MNHTDQGELVNFNIGEKIIDFTPKVLLEGIQLKFYQNYEVGDVMWWGLCLVNFKYSYNQEFINRLDSILRENNISFRIIDNHSDKQFLIIFDVIDKPIFKSRGIVLRKGSQPCVTSEAEKRSNVQWYHFSNITSEDRIAIAEMYMKIYKLLSESMIESPISIVRDLYSKEYILIEKPSMNE